MLSTQAFNRAHSSGGNGRTGMQDPASCHAASQDRSRSPAVCHSGHMPSVPSAYGSISHGCASGSGVMAGGAPSWSTGDKDLDHWLHSLNLEGSVYARLSQVTDVWDRRHIVSACKENLPRVRSMGAFMNGCITKSLNAQRTCKAQQGSQGNPYAVAAAASTSARPSFPAGLGNSTARPVADVPAASSARASAATVLPEASTAESRAVDTCPANDDASVWQAWSTRVMQNVDHKSKFLREVMQDLDHALASQLAALPVEWQFTIACAVALLARDGQCPKNSTTTLLRAYAQTMNKPSMDVLAVSPSTAPSKCVVIHFGALVGMTHIAFKAALSSILSECSSSPFEISEVYSFPSCAVSKGMEQRCLADLGLRALVLDDTKAWPRLCLERKRRWRTEDVRLLIIYAMDVRAARVVATGDSIVSSLPLHSQENADLWLLLAGMKYLSVDFDATRMSVLSWCSSELECRSGDDLEGWLGPSMSANPFRYKCPQVTLSMRSVPLMEAVVGNCAGAGTGTSEGWCWRPAVQKQPRSALRRGPWSPAILQLFDLVIFKDRPLNPAEEQVINACKRTHAESGQTRLLDVPRVCAFFGVEDAAVRRAFDQELPCLGCILATTGTACKESSGVGEPCGENRWCINCEQALRLLWCSPPVPLLCDYMAAWMRALLVNCQKDDKSSSAFVWKSLPDHVCGDKCASVLPGTQTDVLKLRGAVDGGHCEAKTLQ